MWSCSSCNKVYKHKRDLMIHNTKIHPSRSDGKFSCKDCNKTFQHKNNYSYHILHYHRSSEIIANEVKKLSLKNFSCQICFKAFKFKLDLEDHVSQGLHNPFICIDCHKSFQQKSDYVDHILSCHRSYDLIADDVKDISVQKFSCDVCDQKFKFKHDLNRHMESHEQLSSSSLNQSINKGTSNEIEHIFKD